LFYNNKTPCRAGGAVRGGGGGGGGGGLKNEVTETNERKK
jgi:hypothetical protein